MPQAFRPCRLFFLICILTLATVPPAGAQDAELSLAFDPVRPVAGETFLVLVSGVGHGCFTGRHSTAIEGNEVTLTFSDHCPIFTGPKEFTYRMELTLPAGDWVVNVYNSFTDTLATKEVVVREEPVMASSGAAGATLLFPYFEVDPTDPDGVTTLLAIGNAAGSQTLARVVLWTDRGIPTLAFNLALDPGSVQTINLRDVFAGNLPETPAPTEVDPFPYPFCSDPVHVPQVNPTELRAKHSGQPAPGDGLCYSTGRGPDHLVAGYVTVDVIRWCSDLLHSDPEYFESDSSPLAGTRNVLWGDQFFVDTGENFAQGFEAVVIPAEPGKAGTFATFYRRFSTNGADARVPLPRTHLARSTIQSSFEGETDLLLWIENLRDPQPVACDTPPHDDCPPELHVTFTEERGGDAVEDVTVPSPPVAGRFRVGGPELPVTAPSTVARLDAFDPTTFCTLIPPEPISLQMSVSTVMKAFGRFSVGFRGVAPVD